MIEAITGDIVRNDMKKENCKIGIIGIGSMGTMIFHNFYNDSAIIKSNIMCSSRSAEKLALIKNQYDNAVFVPKNIDLAQNSDAIFLCVKPVDFKAVLTDLAKADLAGKIIISLNATISFDLIESIIGKQKIVKIIPSVTAEVFESPTLVAFNQILLDADKEFVLELLKRMGQPEELMEEELGFGSELMSCMPGFIASIFSEVEKAAFEHGYFDRERISYFLKKTLYGTGKLLLERDMSFTCLMNRVATKGGITMEGVKVIESKMPELAKEIFAVTMAKRSQMAKKVRNDFLA